MRHALACLLFALVLVTPARAADDPLAGLRATCAPAHGVRVCTGMVESFDGTLLDTTVTLPARASRKRLPLVVFLHGLLADKGEYLSETRRGTGPDRGASAYKTLRWNNVWFASRGYAVLNYSARGHGASEGQIELASKHVEVRDARRLIGLLADDRRLAPIRAAKVGVIGSSYGGGQAWLLMTTREERGLQYGTWRSPGGRLVQLAALVPGYTWTDLVQALVPNGRQRSNAVVDPRGGQHAARRAEDLARRRLHRHRGRTPARATSTATSPAPPRASPTRATRPSTEAKRALSEDRSAYFQDGYFRALAKGRQRPLPVLAGQGVTDPIFSPLEVVRMLRRLRAAWHGYPIGMYFGDFEHLTALVKLDDLAVFHRLGNRFLEHYLRGRRRRPPGSTRAWRSRTAIRSASGRCCAHAPGLGSIRSGCGSTCPGRRQTFSPLSDPRGLESDPVVLSTSRGRGCITTTRPPTPGIATWTVPVDRAFTLAGMPRLRFTFSAAAADITFTPRLWDVAPDGTQTLVTRGAWRSVGEDAAGGAVEFELFGAAWRFAAGHRLLLEIPQVDASYFRPDNLPSTARIERARLVLPAARAG